MIIRKYLNKVCTSVRIHMVVTQDLRSQTLLLLQCCSCNFISPQVTTLYNDTYRIVDFKQILRLGLDHFIVAYFEQHYFIDNYYCVVFDESKIQQSNYPIEPIIFSFPSLSNAIIIHLDYWSPWVVVIAYRQPIRLLVCLINHKNHVTGETYLNYY